MAITEGRKVEYSAWRNLTNFSGSAKTRRRPRSPGGGTGGSGIVTGGGSADLCWIICEERQTADGGWRCFAADSCQIVCRAGETISDLNEQSRGHKMFLWLLCAIVTQNVLDERDKFEDLAWGVHVCDQSETFNLLTVTPIDNTATADHQFGSRSVMPGTFWIDFNLISSSVSTRLSAYLVSPAHNQPDTQRLFRLLELAHSIEPSEMKRYCSLAKQQLEQRVLQQKDGKGMHVVLFIFWWIGNYTFKKRNWCQYSQLVSAGLQT